MLSDAVRSRLLARGVVTRCEGAIELQAMLKSGGLPAVGASAFVVPVGLRGGEVNSATGAYTQHVEEAVAVVLMLRVHDATDVQGGETLEALIGATLAAVAGWQAPSSTDVLRLVRGMVLSLERGVLLYQIEFATKTQLRIVE